MCHHEWMLILCVLILFIAGVDFEAVNKVCEVADHDSVCNVTVKLKDRKPDSDRSFKLILNVLDGSVTSQTTITILKGKI